MIDDEIIQCKITNYTNDRYYINKFQHNLNSILKHNKDIIGKKIQVITDDIALRPQKPSRRVIEVFIVVV